MKTKLFLLNFSLFLLLIAMLSTLRGHLQLGAIVLLLSSAIAILNYLWHLAQSYRQALFWQWGIAACSGLLFCLCIIVLHVFSSAMGMTMVFRMKGFTVLYFAAGFLLPFLLLYFSRKGAPEEDKRWIPMGASIGTLLSLGGFLGFAGVLPLPLYTIIYSWVVLLFFYLMLFLIKWIRSHEKEQKRESGILLLITLLFVGFWQLRFIRPISMEAGMAKAILFYGFVPLLLLPLTIYFVKKMHSYTVFLFYFIFLDFYFIQYDVHFKYFVSVGFEGCEGYDQATDFPLQTDPGIPLEELVKEPSPEELGAVQLAWWEKDFSPQHIEWVYEEELPNGDSIKVLSHRVQGFKHYGAIRIPKQLEVSTAPILLELEGGGTGVDISKISTLTQGKCKAQKRQFLSILPSFRGCILRGKNFCFRSEGYYGDPWVGPAEDAIGLLEAVKKIYNKGDDTRVLAQGVSRGATVALVIGGLTDKLDYVIATSTHSKFLDEQVLKNERVGQSFARAFYTPAASPTQIRSRMIASSPYYFASELPPFDLHQGGKDELTTPWHALKLQKRLQELGKDRNMYHFYLYSDKGHGYDDDELVCKSMAAFLAKE